MKTIYLKLITGQYVIGDIISENEKEIKIKKPVGIDFNPMAGGLAFVPYDAFYLGQELNEVVFKKDQIMHTFEPPKEILDNYIKYKSGIMPAPSAQKPDLKEDDIAELAKAAGLVVPGM